MVNTSLANTKYLFNTLLNSGFTLLRITLLNKYNLHVTYYTRRGVINGKAGKRLPYPNVELQSFFKVFDMVNTKQSFYKVLIGKQSF